MQGTTLAVALIGSILVLLLRPGYALAAYIAALVWYPDYLRITIGTLDISAGRIIVTVLLLRCLCNSKLRRNFVWSRLDTWVTLSMVVYVGVYCITQPSSVAIENRGGFLMDTWLAYITVRLIVTDKATLISFIKAASIPLAALAILGVVESVTHWKPFAPLFRFCPWRTLSGEVEGQLRWGLTRATGPFSHSIMFGNCFVMFLPLIWSLRHQRGYWRTLAYVFSGTAIVGALISMSSGPWVAVIVVVFCLTIERYKRWVKLILITLVLACILIQVVSNRPFYRVLADRLNFVGGDWWQRADLIDAAIEDFGQWWLAGYGGKDPGWGSRVGEDVTDVNNEFILKGVQYGILGIIVLCGVLVVAFRGLVHADRQTTDVKLKSMYWSLGSSLVGVITAWQGVNFFGQMNALFYSILGIIGSSFAFAKRDEGSQHRLLDTGNTKYQYPA
jgi:hypothetical protein